MLASSAWGSGEGSAPTLPASRDASGVVGGEWLWEGPKVAATAEEAREKRE